MKTLGQMKKKAQEFQSRMGEMQEKLADLEFTGGAGGGKVEVTLNGKGEARKLRIDPALVTPEDAVENWISENQDIFERATVLFDDLKSAGALDLAKLALANRHMRELILA